MNFITYNQNINLQYLKFTFTILFILILSSITLFSYGVGVEKTFLVHSPLVEKVELVRVGKARRARLFYLRDRVGKAAKTKEQIGARIEDREITIKEDLAEEPVAEEVKEEATVKAEEKVSEEVADKKAE